MRLEEPLAEGRIAEIFPWEDGQVLKLGREWVPDDWLEDEFRVTQAVFATGMRTPKPIELLSLDGRTGIVFERLDGETMLSQIGQSPQKAALFGRMMGEVHADMHARTQVGDLPSYHEELKRKIESVEGAPEKMKRAALERLEALPDGKSLPGGQRLLHGDFHLNNILLVDGEPVVIDWPDAARGHPLGDVARTLVLANLGGLPKNKVLRFLVRLLRNQLIRAYQKAYFPASPFSPGEVEAWIFPVLFGRMNEDIESERPQAIQWLKNLYP